MAKNKNYIRGRAFEYKMATLFKRKGYFVIRSAGSHGPADLIAVKKGQRPIMIQCKTGEKKIRLEERDLFYITAMEAESIAIVASKVSRKPTEYVRLVGLSTEPENGEIPIRESDF